ncbi:sugar transporter, partial [Pseudomonas syringae pv. tagetis]
LLITAIGTLNVCLIMLLQHSRDAATLGTLTKISGMAIKCFGLTLHARVLSLAPDPTDVAMAQYSAIFNIGIGGGAQLASVV